MSEVLPPDDRPTNSIRRPSVRPLTMAMENGTPYTRAQAVENEIVGTLCWSESDVLGRRKSLSNEALVYNVRRFRGSADAVRGLLLSELGKRTSRIVKAGIRGLEELDKEDVVMQVELEILELAMAPEPSRQSEFLEIAFIQAVRRHTINRRQEFTRTVQAHRVRFKSLDPDEQEEEQEIERPIELVPDSRDGPEAALAAFEDEQFRGQAYEVVRAALAGEDNRLLLAFRLHVVDRWPVWSADPKVPTVARHFGLTPGQSRYMLEKIRKIAADVLAAYSARKKMAATGVVR